MAQNVSPAELSLSEFLTKLVTDASEAFLVAQQHQESYYADLESASTATPAEFSKAIPEAELDRQLANLFPSADPAWPHAIFVGAVYRPSRPGVAEEPPIQQMLGVRLLPEASTSVPSMPETGSVAKTVTPGGPQPPSVFTTHLSQEQVQLIRDAVRLQVSVRQQGYLKRVLSQPRVGIIMDSARITAKVVLGARPEDSELASSTANAAEASSSTPVQRLVKSPPPLQLSVRMVDDKAPQTNGTSVDIYSEIELKLKSIVS